MSKIYIEVPKTTDMITASVPCGKSELAYEFAKSLIPYMTIEVFDSEIRPFTKVVRGTLYVALERGKNHGKYLQRG